MPHLEIFGLLLLPFTVLLQSLIFGAIFRKAGYSARRVLFLVLITLVPGVSFFVLVWYATSTWPLEMGYVAQPDAPEADAAWELKMTLRRALAHKKRGQSQLAIQQFERVVQRAGKHPNADLAREHIRQIRAQLGVAS